MAPDGFAIRRIDWGPAEEGAGADGPAPRGSLLFLPGRGDAYEKYLETLDGWAGQGWRVTAMDWRGQGGSGRLGADAVTGGEMILIGMVGLIFPRLGSVLMVLAGVLTIITARH